MRPSQASQRVATLRDHQRGINQSILLGHPYAAVPGWDDSQSPVKPINNPPKKTQSLQDFAHKKEKSRSERCMHVWPEAKSFWSTEGTHIIIYKKTLVN
jgi:hypothetical protein